MKPILLYLVRHGAIISVAGKAYIGQIEAPLSDEGVEQAWALRKWLEPVRFNLVFSSDLSRAHRTCKIIAGRQAAEIHTYPALHEISLGQWEGHSFHEIEETFPEAYAARGRDMENWCPQGGESFADCHVRVMRALDSILEQAQGNVLMVGHAGVNRLILCDILGIPIANLLSSGQDYGCVNIVDLSGPRARVKLINYVPLSTRPFEQIAEARSSKTAGLGGR